MPTATLVVSPLASRIRDAAVRASLVRDARIVIGRRGFDDVEVVESGDPATIAAATRTALDRGDRLVVIAGGDGTLRDASAALAASGVDVGILPCGTGNLYATAVGVPRAMPAALEALATGVATPFDHATVQFVAPPGDTAGPMPPAWASASRAGQGSMPSSSPRPIGSRSAATGSPPTSLPRAGCCPASSPSATTLIVDGVRIELEAVVVLVANCGEAIPGTLRPRLPLDAADGLLHVFVLPRGGIMGGVRGMLELMIAETRGSSASGHSVRLAGHEVRVEMMPAAPTQVDGDAYPPAWLEARVEPGALRIIGGAAG